MSIHARLNEPLELRREILECAVVSTDAIINNENLKQLSKDKKKTDKKEEKKKRVDVRKVKRENRKKKVKKNIGKSKKDTKGKSGGSDKLDEVEDNKIVEDKV